MEDPAAQPARASLGRGWFSTIWTLGFAVATIAFFIRGAFQGWTLAALILNGVAIVIFVGAFVATVMGLRHQYRRRRTSGAEAPDKPADT